MFQSSKQRLRAWLQRTEEFLGADPVDALAADPRDALAADLRDAQRSHPHRRELRWDRPRRPGSVPPRPAYCISPVRPLSAPDRRDRAAR